MRRLNAFNKELLNKWRWRILKGPESLRYKVLKDRYEDICMKVVSHGGSFPISSSYSTW